MRASARRPRPTRPIGRGRLGVVAVLTVAVAAVDPVGASVGGSPIPPVVGFALAVALLGAVLELGVVLFTTEDADRLSR